MGDLIRSFYEYGKIKESNRRKELNDIHKVLNSNKDTVLLLLNIDVLDYSYSISDLSIFRDRIIFRKLSQNGGNLYPCIPIYQKQDKDFIIKPITKGINNIKKYIFDKEVLNKINNLSMDYQKIETITKNILSKKNSKENIYLALSLDGKFFNEIYPEAFENFINTKGESTDRFKGYCFIDNSCEIGFDPQLNFCSVDNLPKTIAKNTKYRLLPLSNSNGKATKLGFELFFNKQSPFRYRLFGLEYILIPTILIDDKEECYIELEAIKNRDRLESRKVLEEDLESLLEDLDKKALLNSMLFTMIFIKEGNNEIVLRSTIEDVAPSKISKISQVMEQKNITAKNLSKYTKKEIKEINPNSIYIRDYISDELYLAKLLFGKEFLSMENFLINLSNKILYGNTRDKEKRELSKIINNYYKDDTDFSKHQQLIDFFSEFDILNQLNLGGDMSREFNSLDELIKYRFDESDLLKSQKAKEFYVVGLFSSLVIAWQNRKNDNNSSLAKELDSIGLINSSNIDRVFNRVILGAKKYQMYGEKYSYLTSLYSEIKLNLKDEKLSSDRANIVFVLGAVDYKKIKKQDSNE